MIGAAVLGAAWRRWFGSARPSWAFPGYRFMQIAAGFAVLFGLCQLSGDSGWFAAVKSGAVIGFMTMPIRYSRRPFEWITERFPLPTTGNLPHPWKPMLQGPAPWAEALQGMCLWPLAVLL